MERRTFVGSAALALLAGCAPKSFEGIKNMEETYGIIGQLKTQPGKRSELIAYLLAGTRDMPGNIAYLVAEDLDDPDSLWITEIWRTKTDHANSLKLPSVQEAIAKGRPLIAGFGTRAETRPIAYAG